MLHEQDLSLVLVLPPSQKPLMHAKSRSDLVMIHVHSYQLLVYLPVGICLPANTRLVDLMLVFQTPLGLLLEYLSTDFSRLITLSLVKTSILETKPTSNWNDGTALSTSPKSTSKYTDFSQTFHLKANSVSVINLDSIRLPKSALLATRKPKIPTLNSMLVSAGWQ